MDRASVEGGSESLTPEAPYRKNLQFVGTETVRAAGGEDKEEWVNLGFKV